uniref:Oogenesis-related gene n=1 Tax=Oryzias sinensis TaxID=183150 RepID=A0A8C7YCC5_9TELE
MVTAVSAPPRPCRRKRLRRVTRALLSVLPRWVQSALGFPGPRSIGVALSPEIRSSPAKPDGKGSKRKQDDLDDDEEEEDHPSWVEALTKELVDDEGPAEDPDYEVGPVCRPVKFGALPVEPTHGPCPPAQLRGDGHRRIRLPQPHGERPGAF